jgi:exodeoxyribonuclease VII large subunit
MRYNDHMPIKPPAKRETLTISQLNRQAKRLLEGTFASVWIEGELSNFSKPSSGHWYFTLKDSAAQVRCAMFRTQNARLRFQPEAGQQVVIRAKLSLYEARGDYQLIAEYMEPTGDGALARDFEALKAKLQVEGLFEASLKRSLPSLPRHIAVVTSATGAAIHDILSVLARRFAQTQVTIVPTVVQGQSAGAQISAAIALANRAADDYGFDVLLVSRGGGSIEDLWAFNEEIVARAIVASELPVVSAVGHEVDFTIADFVADVRAPTPSAAAELLSPDADELAATLAGFEQQLLRSITQRISGGKTQVQSLRSQLRHPGSRLREQAQRLDELEIRLTLARANRARLSDHRLVLLAARLRQQNPGKDIGQKKINAAELVRRLQQQMLQQLAQQKSRLANSVQLLNAVSPLATLDRGYAIVSDNKQRVVSAVDQISPGQSLFTRLANGTVESTVERIVGEPSQGQLL